VGRRLDSGAAQRRSAGLGENDLDLNAYRAEEEE
jgi:hypothetical protein